MDETLVKMVFSVQCWSSFNTVTNKSYWGERLVYLLFSSVDLLHLLRQVWCVCVCVINRLSSAWTISSFSFLFFSFLFISTSSSRFRLSEGRDGMKIRSEIKFSLTDRSIWSMFFNMHTCLCWWTWQNHWIWIVDTLWTDQIYLCLILFLYRRFRTENKAFFFLYSIVNGTFSVSCSCLVNDNEVYERKENHW